MGNTQPMPATSNEQQVDEGQESHDDDSEQPGMAREEEATVKHDIPPNASPPPMKDEHVMFRQLLKLITHGTQMERACELMQELRDRTAQGGGFLLRSEYDESKVRPELRVMQQCLLSENDRLLKLACETYVLLLPNPERFRLWFGVTAEHISWAIENETDDMDARRILALDSLCTLSIAEDIRLMMATHEDPDAQLLALRALGVLLLHPRNRSPTLFTESDVRLLTSWLPVGRDGSPLRQKARKGVSSRGLQSPEYQAASLRTLAAWSMCWMPFINENIAGLTSPANVVPLFCQALVLQLLDQLNSSEIEEGSLESALSILSFLSPVGLALEKDHPAVGILISRFLAKETSQTCKFFASMLLIQVARSNLERTSEIGLPTKEIDDALSSFVAKEAARGPSAKTRPEAVEQSLLLACVVSFRRYDALLHSKLAKDMESKKDPGFAAFWSRFVRSSIAFLCSWFFTKLSSRMLVLPKSVSLSFVLGLAHGEVRLFDMIAAIFTRPNARDFAAEAYAEGVTWFFQNMVSQFMYPTDAASRRLSVKCCKYLVAGFVSHHLGEDINLQLYHFLLARLLEMEEVKFLCDEKTVSARKTLKMRELKTHFDEECQSMLYLLRLGVTILYRPSDPQYERSAFNDFYDDDNEPGIATGSEAGSADEGNERTEEDTSGDEPEKNKQKHLPRKHEASEMQVAVGALARQDADNPWNRKGERRNFLMQIIRDFFDVNDSILKFACGRAIASLIHRDEDAKRSVLLSGLFLEGLASQKEAFTQEQLTILRTLVKEPGGAVIWLCLERNIKQMMQNRAGGRPAVLITADDGIVSPPDRSHFVKGQVVLIPSAKRVNATKSTFFVGARVSHVENGVGVIVQEDEQSQVYVSFDSGLYRSYYAEELATKARVLGAEDPAEKNSQWTMVFNVGSSFMDTQTERDANSRIRVLCQGKNGDVHCGVLGKRLGCYDAAAKRWYTSTVFLQDKSQTLVVIGREKRTVFHMVDEAGGIVEFGVADFHSKEDVFSVGNGVMGENPFGVLNEFTYYPFAWEDHEFRTRLLSQWDPELPRKVLTKFNSGTLVRKLRTLVLSQSATTSERRLSALIICNLALCPQIRLQVLNMLGLDAETFLLEFAKEDALTDQVGNGRISMLDWEARARLISALI